MIGITDLVVDVAERVLPLDLLRGAALPPVRAARQGAVAVARTVRHWELALGGEEDEDALVAEGEDRSVARPVPGDRARTIDLREPIPDGDGLAADDLPVDGWAELSFGDAQARMAACDADDLRTLLAYEQAHGHRPQFTLLLENRLAGATSAPAGRE